jgi:Fe2+ or Zn2+ uptake regulation protein
VWGCGRVEDLTVDAPELPHDPARRAGYAVTSHTLVLTVVPELPGLT